jgi:hypothetical protein
MSKDHTFGGVVKPNRDIPPSLAGTVRRQTDVIGSTNPAGGEVDRKQYEPARGGLTK